MTSPLVDVYLEKKEHLNAYQLSFREILAVAYDQDRSVTPNEVAVRDSKNISGPILNFPDSSWAAFLGGRTV